VDLRNHNLLIRIQGDILHTLHSKFKGILVYKLIKNQRSDVYLQRVAQRLIYNKEGSTVF